MSKALIELQRRFIMTTIGAILCGLVAALLLVSATSAEQRCERLKATLTYTQEKAPRDLSGLVSAVPREESNVDASC